MRQVPKRSSKARSSGSSGSAPLGFEATLWAAADTLRGSMDAAEYKHVVLGLIFLKYISDSFETRHAELLAQAASGADPEERDEYRSENVFWVPPDARWKRLQEAARQPELGGLVDSAMEAIEVDNPRLKGVLPKDYSRPGLDKRRLGELIDLISNIGLGGAENNSRDVLGRTYEYFLSQFAGAEGKKAGEFYTPRGVVRLLVEMIEPYAGRVYDPCCGSAGMFVQSEAFIEAHGGRRDDIAIFGQESNHTTWRLAQMNLAIRGIEADLGGEHADSFHHDLHPDLRADFILANPPFNDDMWGGESLRDDPRWRYGVPPPGNANFAWVQHFIHHLAPNGIAGFVLSNGSMSSSQSGDGETRKNIVEADLVDCMVALPSQLFYGTAIPACLWFIAKDKSGGPTRGGARFRDRRREILFVNARGLGSLVDRTHRELSDSDRGLITRAYHAWRGQPEAGEYRDTAGFCRSLTIEELRDNDFMLVPGRYVGAQLVIENAVALRAELSRLSDLLLEQINNGQELSARLRQLVDHLRQ
jgi:type I restriction enzyme M protein